MADLGWGTKGMKNGMSVCPLLCWNANRALNKVVR
jgi:hypothetical protein